MKSYFAIALLALIFIISFNLFSEKIASEIPPIPPAPELIHAHMGYQKIMADTFWLRFIQEVEYCGYNSQPYEQSFSKSTKKRMGRDRVPSCSKGWGYSMLKVIMGLDSRFHFAIQMGPIALSVVADDIDGATELFKESTALFPNDWKIHYDAGYHFMIELEDYEAAYRYFQRASILGAPRWLPLLVAKLQTKVGKSWLAETTLKNFIRTVGDDEKLKTRALKKLKSIRDNN